MQAETGVLQGKLVNRTNQRRILWVQLEALQPSKKPDSINGVETLKKTPDVNL